MDQLKEFLRQASKHRFWIAIGLAALLPLIAFFVGTGALAEQEKVESKKITDASAGAAKYRTGVIQNNQWKEEVLRRTDELTKDVVKSHEKLYGRQEGLLTWPAPVVKTIQEWGPKYPAGTDAAYVNDVILEYTQAYDEYVEQVYSTFKPFDYKTGKGIVAAPPMAALLRPVKFREGVRTTLGDVWAAQRKLWIERTMFDVIAKVNARSKAKDWDSAAIKQIVLLEVANALALDQKTQPTDLVDADEILLPGQTAASKTEKAAIPASSAEIGLSGGSLGGLGGAGAAPTGPEPVQFVKSPNKDQYFIVPVALTVYIEQDRIPDLLIELRNSPMSIRVLDFEMVTPLAPVKKPRKGADEAAFAGSMLGGRGKSSMDGGLMGGDGIASSGGGGGGAQMTLSGMQGAGNAYNDSMKGGRNRGLMQQPGAKSKAKSQAREGGKDVKDESIARIRRGQKGLAKDKEQEKSEEDAAESTISNPYFSVVEVKIRGQARFYLPPPKPTTPAPAVTANATPKADPAKPATAPDAKKADPAKPKDAPKADPAKATTPKADAKDAPKADPAQVDPAKPKADAKDAPKVDPAKADPAKDAPKADPAKPKA